MFSQNKNLRSFTLIELLVVLALVAILSVVVFLTLNPAELLKQARDSNRLSDLATINTALNLFSADVTSGFMGTSTVVYTSLVNTVNPATTTCAGMGLPTLPTGWTYNCPTSTQSLRNTNGTGWIPVNFQRISSNSPISQLPIDPINTTSTRLYYTYVSGGSWELNATVEASKNKLGGSGDLVSKDGGSATSMYELGNNLNLNPIETGDSSLVGYWNFEEGPNATSTDRSGYGNHGTWYGTSTAEQHYTTGKVGSYAGYFNGGSDYVSAGTSSALNMTGPFTVGSWVNMPLIGPLTAIIGNSAGYLVGGFNFGITGGMLTMETEQSGGSTSMNVSIPTDQWGFVGYVFNGSTGVLYFNGVGVATSNMTAPASSSLGLFLGKTSQGGWGKMKGLMDDVRIYNRALSASEISALYNATK